MTSSAGTDSATDDVQEATTVTSAIRQWTLDVDDLERMARFWAGVLGYEVRDRDSGVTLWPASDAEQGAPVMWLQPHATPKTTKNRNHPDLVATSGSAAAEVERVLALGGTRVDVGQTGKESFTVLADPEGNEFCILDAAPT